MKGYRHTIEEKLTLHLELLIHYDIYRLFDKNTTKMDLIDIIPLNVEEYHKHNQATIERLEKMTIKHVVHRTP